jgi:hypothetical protein
MVGEEELALTLYFYCGIVDSIQNRYGPCNIYVGPTASV